MTWYSEAAKDSLAEIAVINVIDLPVSVGVAYYLSVSILAVFGFIVLLEATGLMFIGGAMDLGTSAGSAGLARLLKLKAERGSDDEAVKRKRFQRAIVFVLSGALLFLESMLLAVPYL